ncbi:ion channel [Bacillus sp. SG-1]|uniref:ion channel n=1 Tax=Bacillus sp. SG-1 TaxID=161544 RepID=UPI0005C5D725|nr:ion channel [Bacillus sp. SG-1]
MMVYILIAAIALCMTLSLRTLFFPSKWREKHLSIRNFLLLGMSYLVLMLGFGLVYVLLEVEGIDLLVEGGDVIQGDFLDHLFTCLYFSGVTLFSVGYGDVTPIGIGRGIALFESWLGYTIPAAFVIKSFFIEGQSKETNG